MLCKFYFETDEYRKDNDKLTWFGEREGNLKFAQKLSFLFSLEFVALGI